MKQKSGSGLVNLCFLLHRVFAAVLFQLRSTNVNRKTTFPDLDGFS